MNDKDEFFKKYGFKLYMEKPHPKFKDTISFSGLEADYVSSLERELEFYKEAYERLRQKLDFMTTQEMYRIKDLLDKEKLK